MPRPLPTLLPERAKEPCSALPRCLAEPNAGGLRLRFYSRTATESVFPSRSRERRPGSGQRVSPLRPTRFAVCPVVVVVVGWLVIKKHKGKPHSDAPRNSVGGTCCDQSWRENVTVEEVASFF
ncbi:hypothetical protein lerEdw1_020277 [Lerista edwardsae]|nr:hypothetical protein lerEdw1_020277 [Lerista edwardsae]